MDHGPAISKADQPKSILDVNHQPKWWCRQTVTCLSNSTCVFWLQANGWVCWARFPPATPPPKCNCRFILNSVAHSVTLHSNPFHPTPSLTHSTYLNIPLLCVPLCILLHLTFCHCFLSFFHLPLGFRLSSLATICDLHLPIMSKTSGPVKSK